MVLYFLFSIFNGQIRIYVSIHRHIYAFLSKPLLPVNKIRNKNLLKLLRTQNLEVNWFVLVSYVFGEQKISYIELEF